VHLDLIVIASAILLLSAMKRLPCNAYASNPWFDPQTTAIANMYREQREKGAFCARAVTQVRKTVKNL
jgi:hypothetical protein